MKKKFLIITGDLLKHKYFAIQIIKRIPNTYVFFERYPDEINKNYTNDTSKIIKKHFNEVIKTDKKFFNKYVNRNKSFLTSKTKFEFKKGKINSKIVLKKITEMNPSLIIVNAVSVIKGDLLKKYNNKIINFHAGLSQYYRGAGCNVWAIYYKKIENIGITFHVVNSKIDEGSIIAQAKPKLTKNDNSHTIGCKNTILASNLIIKIIKYFNKFNLLPPLTKIRKKNFIHCYKRDFNKNIVLEVNKILNSGIINKHIKKQKYSKIISL